MVDRKKREMNEWEKVVKNNSKMRKIERENDRKKEKEKSESPVAERE